MVASRLDGLNLATAMKDRLAEQLSHWVGPRPGLAVIAAGDDSASTAYRRSLARQWQGVGGSFFERLWPQDLAPARAHADLQALSEDPTVHGILLQVPLPPHLIAAALWRSLAPAKDI